jgi:hypothetical protein
MYYNLWPNKKTMATSESPILNAIGVNGPLGIPDADCFHEGSPASD